jgi:hypothetical protein
MSGWCSAINQFRAILANRITVRIKTLKEKIMECVFCTVTLNLAQITLSLSFNLSKMPNVKKKKNALSKGNIPCKVEE